MGLDFFRPRVARIGSGFEKNLFSVLIGRIAGQRKRAERRNGKGIGTFDFWSWCNSGW